MFNKTPNTSLQWPQRLYSIPPPTQAFHLTATLSAVFIRSLSLSPPALCRGVSLHRHSLTLLSLLCCWCSVTTITLLTQYNMAVSLSLFFFFSWLPHSQCCIYAGMRRRVRLLKMHDPRERMTLQSAFLPRNSQTSVQRHLLSFTIWYAN